MIIEKYRYQNITITLSCISNNMVGQNELNAIHGKK